MTEQQAGALARALERARANGLAIVGRGEWDRGGARFYVVSSASGAEPHLVTVYPGRLVCGCAAGQHGRMCQHRALAHAELARERQEAEGVQRVADAIERTRRDVCAHLDAVAKARDTALPAAYLAPARPFSVFKSA